MVESLLSLKGMGLFFPWNSQNTEYSLNWNFELYVKYVFQYLYK